MLADNKLALNADWDPDLPAQGLRDLINIDFDLDLIGFSRAEIDLVLTRQGRPAPIRAMRPKMHCLSVPTPSSPNAATFGN